MAVTDGALFLAEKQSIVENAAQTASTNILDTGTNSSAIASSRNPFFLNVMFISADTDSSQTYEVHLLEADADSDTYDPETDTALSSTTDADAVSRQVVKLDTSDLPFAKYSVPLIGSNGTLVGDDYGGHVYKRFLRAVLVTGGTGDKNCQFTAFLAPDRLTVPTIATAVTASGTEILDENAATIYTDDPATI